MRAIEWTREAGIYIIANYMVGLPDDDLTSMQQTLDEAKYYNFEFLNLYCTMAYPGSKLFDHALENKEILPKTWDGYSQLGYTTEPLPTKHLTAVDVLKFRDQGFLDFYRNPAYLEMIKAKFGTDVLNHVQQMTKVGLKRSLLGD